MSDIVQEIVQKVVAEQSRSLLRKLAGEQRGAVLQKMAPSEKRELDGQGGPPEDPDQKPLATAPGIQHFGR